MRYLQEVKIQTDDGLVTIKIDDLTLDVELKTLVQTYLAEVENLIVSPDDIKVN